MRSNSGKKQSKHESSRVLISSKSMNRISQKIESRLDIIKQQISREYHEKFPTERKPRGNSDSKSRPKRRLKPNNKLETDLLKETRMLSRKLNFGKDQLHSFTYKHSEQANPNIMQHSESSYRDKYYELQEKLYNSKETNLQIMKQIGHFKELIINFINQPSIQTTHPFTNAQQHPHLQTDHSQFQTDLFTFPERVIKNMQNIVTLNQDVLFAQNTFNEMMRILEVQDLEQLINELTSISKKQQKYKNLSEYSYKIIQLQTKYNQLQLQHQQKTKQITEQGQIKLNNEQQKHKIVVKQLQLQHHEKCQEIHSSYTNQLIDLIQELRIGDIEDYESEASGTDVITHSKNVRQSLGCSQIVEIQSSQEIVGSNQCKKMIVNPVSAYATFNNAMDFRPHDTQLRPEFLEAVNSVRQSFRIMENRVMTIEQQAQQNLELLTSYKNDMQRLQRLMDNITTQALSEKQRIVSQFNSAVQQRDNNIYRHEQILKQREETYEFNVHNLKTQIQKNKQLQQQNQHLRNEIIKQKQTSQNNLNKLLQFNCKQQLFIKTIDQIKQLLRIQFPKSQHKMYVIQQKDEQSVSQELACLSSYNKLMQSLSYLSYIKMNLTQIITQFNEKIVSLQTLNQWQQKQLLIKQSLLQQFDYNLKQLVSDCQQSTRQAEQLASQRDQYKFLLKNIREQIITIKQQHQHQLLKAIEKKDEQYLTSNKDILQINCLLQQQLKQSKQTLRNRDQQLKSVQSSQQFLTNKCQSQQLTIKQLTNKVSVMESEQIKLKQCLTVIQSSFKEVENMSQFNSVKMHKIQQQNDNLVTNNKYLQQQNKQLQKIIDTHDKQHKCLQYQYEDQCKKYQLLNKIKQEIEYENSQFRINKLQFNEKYNESRAQNSTLVTQNHALSRQNSKLSQQVTQLSRKMLEKVSPIDHKINRKRRQIQSIIDTLKRVYQQQVREQIIDSVNNMKMWLGGIMGDIIQQINTKMRDMQLSKTQSNENKAQKLILEGDLLKCKTDNDVLSEKIKILEAKCDNLTQEKISKTETHMQYVNNENIQAKNLQQRNNSQHSKLIKQINNLHNSTKTAKKAIQQLKLQLSEQLNKFHTNLSQFNTQYRNQLIVKQNNNNQKVFNMQTKQLKLKLQIQSLANELNLIKQEMDNNKVVSMQIVRRVRMDLTGFIETKLESIKQENQQQLSKRLKQQCQQLNQQHQLDQQLQQICKQRLSSEQDIDFGQQINQKQEQRSDNRINCIEDIQQDADDLILSLRKQQQPHLLNDNQQSPEKPSFKNQQIVSKIQQQFYSPQFLRLRKTQQQSNENNEENDRQYHMEQEEEKNSKSTGKTKKNRVSYKIDGSESERVNFILQALRQSNWEELYKLSYFEQIRGQVQKLRKRIRPSLNLDISGVSFRPVNPPSPFSVSFCKDILVFDRKLNSEPEEIGRQKTNRSDHVSSVPNLKHENEHLKHELYQLEIYIREMEQRQEQLKIEVTELEKQNTKFQNDSSRAVVEKLMLRFIDSMVNEKIDEMESHLRVMMKVIGIEEQELDKIHQYFQKKKRKKTFGGFFSK